MMCMSCKIYGSERKESFVGSLLREPQGREIASICPQINTVDNNGQLIEWVCN